MYPSNCVSSKARLFVWSIILWRWATRSLWRRFQKTWLGFLTEDVLITTIHLRLWIRPPFFLLLRSCLGDEHVSHWDVYRKMCSMACIYDHTCHIALISLDGPPKKTIPLNTTQFTNQARVQLVWRLAILPIQLLLPSQQRQRTRILHNQSVSTRTHPWNVFLKPTLTSI